MAMLEQNPLLLDVSDDENVADEAQIGEEAGADTVDAEGRNPLASTRYLIQLCTLMLIFDFAQYSIRAPLTAIFEEIVCNHYYSSNSDPHFLLTAVDCKAAPVQAEVATVIGYKESFNQIPSILLSIPLGLLADRAGRKPVIFLHMLGLFLDDSWVKLVCLFPNQFPLRLVWLAPLFKAIGGGENFGTSIVFTAAVDVFAGKDRVDVLLKLAAMEMIVHVAGGPLVSVLMSINYWYALATSTILLLAAGPIVYTLPETHPQWQHGMAHLVSPESLEDGQAGACNDNEERQQDVISYFRMVWELVLSSFITSAKLLKSSGLRLSLGVFLFAFCGAHAWALLLQYMHKKFEWEYSLANILFSMRGGITLTLNLFVVGAVDRHIQRRFGLRSPQKDILLSMGSCSLIVAGVAAVGLAPSSTYVVGGLLVSAMGSWLPVSFRCAMISLFPQTPVASINAAVAMAQSSGIFVSGPIMAAAFRWGLSRGGLWLGAPFLLSSILHATALAFMFRLLFATVRGHGLISSDSHES